MILYCIFNIPLRNIKSVISSCGSWNCNENSWDTEQSFSQRPLYSISNSLYKESFAGRPYTVADLEEGPGNPGPLRPYLRWRKKNCLKEEKPAEQVNESRVPSPGSKSGSATDMHTRANSVHEWMLYLGPDYMSWACPVSRAGLSLPGSRHVC